VGWLADKISQGNPTDAGPPGLRYDGAVCGSREREAREKIQTSSKAASNLCWGVLGCVRLGFDSGRTQGGTATMEGARGILAIITGRKHRPHATNRDEPNNGDERILLPLMTRARRGSKAENSLTAGDRSFEMAGSSHASKAGPYAEAILPPRSKTPAGIPRLLLCRRPGRRRGKKNSLEKLNFRLSGPRAAERDGSLQACRTFQTYLSGNPSWRIP